MARYIYTVVKHVATSENGHTFQSTEANALGSLTYTATSKEISPATFYEAEHAMLRDLGQHGFRLVQKDRGHYYFELEVP